jgi:chromosome segregation ATPase
MKYCIYCGARLPQAAPPTAGPPQPALPPARPPAAPPPARPPYAVGVRDEIAHLMAGITALYERKAVLLDLLQSGKVSERVFLKLYNEYDAKLKDFLNARVGRIKELRSELDEKSKRLSEVAVKLEELEVRHKVGEVDTNFYSQEAEKLRAEERKLVDSVKTLRINIERLEKMLAEKKSGEIRDLETNMKSHQSTIEKLVEEGKISSETFAAIKPNMDETLRLFDSLIKERKDKEKELREQLETLQTRYKLSELSIEEYERKKRELQAQIDEIWA